MARRFISIWFRHLLTDWFTVQDPGLTGLPLVISSPSHGRIMINAVNSVALKQGIQPGMVLADARAIIPTLQVMDDKPGLTGKLLNRFAEWCIRFAPVVAIDPPEGLLLDVSGCTHLWGGEEQYLKDINSKITERGYQVRIAMADSIGAAWGFARFGKEPLIIPTGSTMESILPLPPVALRLEAGTLERLQTLGLRQIMDFLNIPRTALRRRFGQQLIQQLHRAIGLEEEILIPVQPPIPYQERLPCLEPIVTATGIEIALQRLLEALCHRLQQEQKGLRVARLKCYRMDGKIVQVEIGTHRPSHHIGHLFKLFENKLSTIEPDTGIEFFILEAPATEDHIPAQERLWEGNGGLADSGLSELIDRLNNKLGAEHIHRYVAAEHYWPERSVKPAATLHEKPVTEWKTERPRPIQLLPIPERIEVTAPIPDYPPMLFRYKGQLHKILRADGPERIEPEWWITEGEHRDYYTVEDENGQRYWLFRLGHYTEEWAPQWFLHGFFA